MKKFLSFILILTMVLSVSSFAMAAGGAGTEADPFLIGSADELAAFRNAVNGGDSYEGKYVKLTTSITLTDDNWTPIGTGTRSGSGYASGTHAFKGTFDGGNNTISGLKITSAEAKAAIGLFGIVDGGTVKDLTLSDVSINATGNENAGAAIGLMVNGATADNITVSGSVSAADGVGGIVGRMTISGTISNCVNNAAVTSAEGGGGIVGKAYYTGEGKVMTISDCTNNGTVTGDYAAGGIAGLSAADVSGCKNTAAITAGTEAGGIVGEQVNRGVVSGNTNSGAISNKSTGGTAYGGIIGWIRYQTDTSSYPAAANEVIEVSNNTNSGNISASGATLGSGGIVGTVYNQAYVTGNTNTADSITGGTFASGIVGGAQKADNNTVIEGATIRASNNVSTTAVSSITANCVASDMYNNAPDTFVAEDNSAAWAAEVDGVKYTTLQAAVAAAGNGDTVTLLADCAENVTVVQKEGVKFTIDGAGKTMTGSITVDGKSQRYETAGVTIKNFEFDAKSITTDACINLGEEGNTNTRYTNNVTVEGCTFTDSANARTKVAIKSYTGGDWNLKVIGCESDNTMHSLLQVANVEKGLVVDGCTVTSKNGINLNSSENVEIKNSTIDVSGYAVRAGVDDSATGEQSGTSGKITLTDNILKTSDTTGEDAVIILRDSAARDVDLTMTKNVVSGALHIMGAEEGTVISADANYWDGEEAPIVPDGGEPVEVESYYEDEALTKLVGPASEEEEQPTVPAKPRDSIKVTYNGGNSFSTSKSAVPTSVEIDGVPVPFTGNGKLFTVGCIDPDAEWVTVRWNSTSVTVNFKPDVTVSCPVMSIPKTGDMPLWMAVAEFFGF